MKVFLFTLVSLSLLGCSKDSGGSLVSESQGNQTLDQENEPPRADDPSVVDGVRLDDEEVSGEMRDEVFGEGDSEVPPGSPGDESAGDGGSSSDDPGGEGPQSGGAEDNRGADTSLTRSTTFTVDPGFFALNNGEGTVALRWDGCEGSQYAMGGYNSDTRCGKAFLLPSFRSHLESHFQQCVINSAILAGLSKPVSIFVRHVGTFNNRDARGATRKSMHAFARAIDLVNINLFDSTGRETRISTHVRDYSGATAIFYDELRKCWADSLPPACAPGQIEHLGSIGHTSSQLGGNSLHSDHLHLSYPLCAGGS